MLWCVFGAFLVLSAAPKAYYVWSDHAQTRHHFETVTADMARILEEHARGIFQANHQAVQRVADLIAPNGVDGAGLSPEVGRQIRAVASSLPQPGAIWILDREGKSVFASNLPQPPAMDYADREYFQEHRQGVPFVVGRLIKSRSLDTYFYTYSLRLENPDGGFAGVVAIATEARHLTAFYRSLDLGPHAMLGIYRSDGAIVVREPLPESAATMDGAGSVLFRQLLPASPTGTYTTASVIDGIRRIHAYHRIADLPLVVVAGIDEDYALSGWRQRLHQNLWIWLGTVAAFGLPMGLAFVSIRREETAREALKEALADKDVLFREVHHRVKNNLQTVVSLLTMQKLRFRDEELQAALQQTLDRVQSMALVHQILYQTNQATHVDLAQYLRDLCDSLSATYGAAERGIAIDVRLERCDIDLERAIPLALALNEVITNALKHAFPGGRAGTIHVSAERVDGRYLLTVRDGGVGLPEAANKPTGIGLHLIQSLVAQAEGTHAFERDGGTVFRVVLPVVA